MQLSIIVRLLHSGVHFFHELKASNAACIAYSACSLFALETLPINSFMIAGLNEAIFSSVMILSPLMINGYSIPNCEFTLCNASLKAFYFLHFVKSVKGSYANAYYHIATLLTCASSTIIVYKCKIIRQSITQL